MDLELQNSLPELKEAWITFIADSRHLMDADSLCGDEELEVLVALDEELRAERAAEEERLERLIDENEAFELDQLEHRLRLWKI